MARFLKTVQPQSDTHEQSLSQTQNFFYLQTTITGSEHVSIIWCICGSCHFRADWRGTQEGRHQRLQTNAAAYRMPLFQQYCVGVSVKGLQTGALTARQGATPLIHLSTLKQNKHVLDLFSVLQRQLHHHKMALSQSQHLLSYSLGLGRHNKVVDSQPSSVHSNKKHKSVFFTFEKVSVSVWSDHQWMSWSNSFTGDSAKLWKNKEET